jgi:hypothetical protein
MFIPPAQKRLGFPGPPEHTPTEFLPPNTCSESKMKGACANSLTDHIRESVLHHLPNDLTRMIYLASLRDCNSGLYLHPELSREQGQHAADRAFRMCHEEIFRHLLATRLSDCVDQLREYIRYTRGEAATIMRTWKSLQAYRATVPVGAQTSSTELFALNLSIALEILSQQMPDLQSA